MFTSLFKKIEKIKKEIINASELEKPKLNDEFSVRQSPAGRTYFEHNIAKTTQTPTYRYAKNYTIGDKNVVKFCLMILTTSESEKTIESFLDNVAKQIDIASAQRVVMTATDTSFEYTDFYFNEETK